MLSMHTGLVLPDDLTMILCQMAHDARPNPENACISAKSASRQDLKDCFAIDEHKKNIT